MIKLNVEGMTCGGCARSVTNAVKRVDPGASLNIDVASRKVDLETSASFEEVRGAIEAAGYRVVLLPA